jgi:hypothetical protein
MILDPFPNQSLEDAQDSALLRQAIAESSSEFLTVEEVLEAWGLTQEELQE